MTRRLRPVLSRWWLAFLCWPSGLAPWAYCSVVTAIVSLSALLFYLGLAPPSGLANIAGAETETAEERKQRWAAEEASDARAKKQCEDVAEDADRRRIDRQKEQREAKETGKSAKKGGRK